MGQLVRNDQVPSADLPEVVQEYLAMVPEVSAPEHASALAGQQLFAAYGPEMLMLLACYAVPATYAARKGVQVVYRTGYLADRPNRRLFQTTQMVIDVMTPGGLDAGGRGRRTAQKVRLMHAAIRHLLLNDGAHPWPDELGLPINQEDLAGTLMTFTSLILRGLEGLKIHLTAEQSQAYLDAWRVVGRLMGVIEDLIPATVADAHALSDKIQARHVEPSAEGRVMTMALLKMLESYTPVPFKHMPSAILRHFLPAEVADGLGVEARRLDAELVNTGISLGHTVDRLTGGGMRRKIFRDFSMKIVQLGILSQTGGHRTDFRIPTSLRESWQLPSQ